MILINKKIHQLPNLNEAQSSLPLPLSAPIKVEGQVNDVELMQDMVTYLSGLTDSDNTDNNCQYSIQIGVDEVGRGPLYGSVVVSAAILPQRWSGDIETSPLKDTPLSTLTDSKKLTEVKREKLFEPIKNHALGYLIIDVPAAVIDEVNILQATMLGMRLACEQLLTEVTCALTSQINRDDYKDEYDSSLKDYVEFCLLIDGNKVPDLDLTYLESQGIGGVKGCPLKAEALVKGDGRHTAIAAASVLAKVSRDRQVIQDGLEHPGYGLEGHKGYPTKAHIEAMNRLGVLPQHRRSFRPVQEALTQSLKKV